MASCRMKQKDINCNTSPCMLHGLPLNFIMHTASRCTFKNPEQQLYQSKGEGRSAAVPEISDTWICRRTLSPPPPSGPTSQILNPQHPKLSAGRCFSSSNSKVALGNVDASGWSTKIRRADCVTSALDSRDKHRRPSSSSRQGPGANPLPLSTRPPTCQRPPSVRPGIRL